MKVNWQNNTTDFLIYASFFLIELFLFLPYLITGSHAFFLTFDDLTQWYPYSHFWVDCIRRGRSFAWYPGVYCGLPFIAWSQSSVLYPPAILNFFLPFHHAVTLEIAIHVFIFTSGAYYMLRRFDCSQDISWICAAHVGISIYLLYAIGHFMPEIYTMSWITWSSGFWAGWVSERRFKYLAGFTLCYSMEVFGGHMELAFYHALSIVGIYGSLAVFNVPGWRVLSRLKAAIPAGAIICLLISALFIPSLELAGFSIRRHGMTYGYFAADTKIVSGNLDFPFDQAVVYASLLIAILWYRKVKRILALLILIPVIVVFQVDIFNVLRLVYRIPPFSVLLLTYKLYVGLILVILLLMGFVMEELAKDRYRRLNWFLAALILFAGFHVGEGIIGQRYAHALGGLAFPVLDVAISRGFYARSAGSAVSILALLLLLRWKRTDHRKRLVTALSLFFFLAVLPAAFFFLPRSKGDPFSFNRELINFASEHSKEGRFATVSRWMRLPREIPPQIGGYWGVRGIDSSVRGGAVWWYGHFLQQIAPDTLQYKDGKLDHCSIHNSFMSDAFFHKEALQLLNFLGLRYVVPYKNNFKLLSHYWFSFDPSIENRYPNNIIHKDGRGESGSAFDIGGKSPFSWDVTLHVLPGDELRFGPPVMALARIFAKSESASKNDLLFEQSLQAKPASPYQTQETRSIPLDEYANKTIKLSFVAETTIGDHFIKWGCPHIFHSQAPFQKLESRTFDVYENRSALPRLTVATRYAVFPEEESRLRFIASAAFKPPDQVILEEDPYSYLWQTPTSSAGNSAQFVTDDADRLVVKAERSAPGAAVISDVYYPGWILQVNGEERKILKANEAFRAVPLKPGESILEMRYFPFSIRTGLWTSITSWLFLAGLTIFRRIKAGKRANSQMAQKQALGFGH